MAPPDRPQPRSRSKATPAVDEAAGATPIAPTAAAPAPAPVPARLISRTATAPAAAFVQLNVRIDLDVQLDLETIMTREGLSKVGAVTDAIRQAAGK